MRRRHPLIGHSKIEHRGAVVARAARGARRSAANGDTPSRSETVPRRQPERSIALQRHDEVRLDVDLRAFEAGPVVYVERSV
jgi:hypothetical protein